MSYKEKKKKTTKTKMFESSCEGEDSSLLFQIQTHIITFMNHLEPKDTE